MDAHNNGIIDTGVAIFIIFQLVIHLRNDVGYLAFYVPCRDNRRSGIFGNIRFLDRYRYLIDFVTGQELRNITCKNLQRICHRIVGGIFFGLPLFLVGGLVGSCIVGGLIRRGVVCRLVLGRCCRVVGGILGRLGRNLCGLDGELQTIGNIRGGDGVLAGRVSRKVSLDAAGGLLLDRRNGKTVGRRDGKLQLLVSRSIKGFVVGGIGVLPHSNGALGKRERDGCGGICRRRCRGRTVGGCSYRRIVCGVGGRRLVGSRCGVGTRARRLVGRLVDGRLVRHGSRGLLGGRRRVCRRRGLIGRRRGLLARRLRTRCRRIGHLRRRICRRRVGYRHHRRQIDALESKRKRKEDG